MNIRSFVAITRTHIVAAALTAAGALLSSALPASAAWQHAHGDSANTGFARVDTNPAINPTQIVQLGPVSPGANPVVGPDGTVYIGNLAGELRAFHADGTPYWTRQINSTHGGISASPVVGSDGSVYVVSSIHYRDHRGGVDHDRFDSFLHKFKPGGAWDFATPFPEQFSTLPDRANRGATNAPPNIWRWNETEAVMVPVLYNPGGLRLIAFSTSGAVLGDTPVDPPSSSPITANDHRAFNDCVAVWGWLGYVPIICPLADLICGGDCGFTNGEPELPLEDAGWPLPGVAIRPDPQGSAPFVMVTDGRHDKVAYAFSPQTGFSEVARSTHIRRKFTTPPVVQANGDTMVGTADGYLTFTGPNFVQLGAIAELGILTAAPTLLADGRIAVINRNGIMTLLGGPVTRRNLLGESIASAAASCTHLFVASTNEFVTFNLGRVLPVARVPWMGGGLASPVIGPTGYVYAIASDSLFVFPAPRSGGVLGRTACDQLAPPGSGVNAG